MQPMKSGFVKLNFQLMKIKIPGNSAGIFLFFYLEFLSRLTKTGLSRQLGGSFYQSESAT
jgi:hypothetical protein